MMGMDAFEKFSFLHLRAEAEIAVLDANIMPTPHFINKADGLCERLAGYILSKFGAKYAGNPEGPRRNHG